MWYFAWILGVCLAASFTILHALWHEVHTPPPSHETPEARPTAR